MFTVGLGLLGASIVVLIYKSDAPTVLEGFGFGAALLATFCYALTLNYARRFAKLDPATIAACSLSGAALVSLPTALLFEGVPVMVRPESWAALLAIGLISSTLAFLLMYWLLPRVGGTNFSINTFITPISAILLGELILGERFQPTHVLGMAVILIGLLAMDGRLVRRLRRRPAAAS